MFSASSECIAPRPEPCRIYRHNARIVSVWAAVWRAWRWVPLGMAGAIRDGLDWQQVESVMRLKGIKKRDRPAIFAGLRIMESALLEALAEQQEKRGKK